MNKTAGVGAGIKLSGTRSFWAVKFVWKIGIVYALSCLNVREHLAMHHLQRQWVSDSTHWGKCSFRTQRNIMQGVTKPLNLQKTLWQGGKLDRGNSHLGSSNFKAPVKPLYSKLNEGPTSIFELPSFWFQLRFFTVPCIILSMYAFTVCCLTDRVYPHMGINTCHNSPNQICVQ